MTSTLRERLGSDAPTRALLTPLPCPMVVTVAARAGFEAVVFDLEHSPRDESALQWHVALARAEGIAPLARLHPAEVASASRLLDLGVTGVLAPAVGSRDDAERVVRALHYPPRGARGFATVSPAGGFGSMSIDDVVADAAAHTLIVAMIESASGVENAEQIAAVDGIDALFVGTADLAVDLGLHDAGHPDVTAAVDRVRAAASAGGCAFLQSGGDGPFVLHNLARLLSRALESALGDDR